MVELGEADRLPPDLLRELDGPAVRAVGDVHRGQLFCGEGLRDGGVGAKAFFLQRL